MIQKKNRFHGHNSLKYVYRRGKTVRGPLTAVKYVKSRREHYRLAVVVSKKVHKSAVKRNRIRRRLYEAVRRLEDQIQQPFDMVLTVFHETLAEMPADQVDKLVYTQLKQAGAFRAQAKKPTKSSS